MSTCYVQETECEQTKQFSSIEERDLEWGGGGE